MLKSKIDNMSNLTEEEKKEFKVLRSRYEEVHSRVDEVQQKILQLSSYHKQVIEELNEVRDSEKELINKLEEKYDIKIDHAKIMEILEIKTFNI